MPAMGSGSGEGKGKEKEGKGQGKGKGKGKGKGGKEQNEARPVLVAPGQAGEAHMGPFSVPAGTEVRGQLKERILEQTNVRVNCRARKSFGSKALTLAGPPQHLAEALRMVAEAMPELNLAVTTERQDPPSSSSAGWQWAADWQWDSAWWWWQQGFWHGSSSWNWQHQATEDESRWSWRRPVATLVEVSRFAHACFFGVFW